MNLFPARIILKLLKLKIFSKHFPAVVGIPVIIQNNKGEILLGKRSKNHIAYKNMWGLPGGLSETHETIKETAIREVKEELGVEIKITKEPGKYFEVMPTKETVIHAIDIPFYGKITKGKPEAKDETQEIKWFKPKEIKKLKLAYNHKEILKKEGLI